MERPKWGSTGGAWSVQPAAIPDRVDVAAIRKAIPGRLTQQAFAKAYGFSFAAVREWEQGRKAPSRASRALLKLIRSNPQDVAEALAQL